MPVYTVLLTELSTAQHEGEQQRFKDQATTGLSLLLAVALPATAVVIALATPITRLLYERGQFTPEETRLTSQRSSRMGSDVCVWHEPSDGPPLQRNKDTTLPAFVGMGSIGLSIGGNWLFREWWGHWGIALVTSVVSYVNTLVLYGFFRHRFGSLNEAFLLRRFGAHLLLANTLGVILFVTGRWLESV